MRWLTFRDGEQAPRVGVIVGDQINAAPLGVDMLQALPRLDELGAQLLASPDALFHLTAVQVLPPVPRPPSFRDFMAFEAHVRNSFGRDPNPTWYELPGFYFSNPAAMVGGGAEVAIAPGSSKWDFELEIGVVLGKGGRDLTPAEAEGCIAGFTILCDYSARDLQIRESGIGLGPVKGKDAATGLGPWLVTPDELGDAWRDGRLHLAASAAINGQTITKTDAGDMHWSFGQMLSYASRGVELIPGDVIGSGTLGRGCIFELRALNGKDAVAWLKPGDRLTLEVEKLGSLSATMVAGKPPVPLA